MDRLIYTAMSGAKHILEHKRLLRHNLANINSTGFRAQLDSFRAVPVVSDGLPTRTFVVDATVGTDFSPGTIQQTGRDLDVAVQTEGWIAVLREDGSEGYTRNGSFKINENGVLQTSNGLSVQGDGGPITIPPDMQLAIANDGTVSAFSVDTLPGAPNVLGRIKLVNPPPESLVRAKDGLFNTANGQPADADATVSLVSGALEGSNVNVVEEMVNMISLARQFEYQMKMMKSAENNADKAGQLLALN